jgi:hypothetical protein
MAAGSTAAAKHTAALDVDVADGACTAGTAREQPVINTLLLIKLPCMCTLILIEVKCACQAAKQATSPLAQSYRQR